ncbi:MAG TPA: dihydrofolate reductase [Candidatus Saccharimonadales bacterium]
MKSIIVGMGKNREIGANQDMPWSNSLPDDLANFRKLSTGKTVIMGYRTFESIGKRPLPNRQNIVISREPTGVQGVLTAHSLKAAYALAQYDIVVMGGGQIYAQAIDDMDVLYVTEVDAEFPEATVFFPEIDKAKWQEASREHHVADERNKYAFDFVVYHRKHDTKIK